MKKYYEKLFFLIILYYFQGKYTEIGLGLVNSK